MRVRSVAWPVLCYGFLFLILVRRAKLAVTEGALGACLFTLVMAYGIRAFMLLPSKGFSQGAAWDVRRWSSRERKRFVYEAVAVCIATAALVIAAWATEIVCLSDGSFTVFVYASLVEELLCVYVSSARGTSVL